MRVGPGLLFISLTALCMQFAFDECLCRAVREGDVLLWNVARGSLYRELCLFVGVVISRPNPTPCPLYSEYGAHCLVDFAEDAVHAHD